MGLLDGVAQTGSPVSMPAPEPGSFQRAGYFQWPKGQSQVVMCLFPPYGTWLQERIAAAQAGNEWRVPFFLGHGLHAVGSNKNNKIYCGCRRTVLGKMNRDGETYPLIPQDIINAGDDCELCRIAWDEFWPNVEAWQQSKDSDEYKVYKAAHKQACPQQKYAMNVLPWGATAVEVYDMPKTVQEGIARIQYDAKQPDLLFPYQAGSWQNSWIQITKTEDQNSTKYSVVPYYTNTPFVQNQDQSFNESGYMHLLSTMKDLREELRAQLLPREGDIERSVQRLLQIVSFSFNTAVKVSAEIQQATAGVVPQTYATGPAAPTALAAPAPAAPPMAPAPAAPAPAGATEPHHQASYWTDVGGVVTARSGTEIQSMIDTGGSAPDALQIMSENQQGGWRPASQFGFSQTATTAPPAPAPTAAPAAPVITAPPTVPTAPGAAAAPAAPIAPPQAPAPAGVPGPVPMAPGQAAVPQGQGGDFNQATEMLQGLLSEKDTPPQAPPPAPPAQ